MSADTHAEPFLLDHDFIQDPYSSYERMRAGGPVREVVLPGGLSAWLVTRYAEAREVLADPRFGKDVERSEEILRAKRPEASERGEFTASLVPHMLNLDPPDHTRLRDLVIKAFTPGQVRRMRPWIERITSDLLDGITERSEVDFVSSFALPLPITVISELLGVDESRRADFRALSNTAVGADRLIAATAVAPLTELLTELIAEKRRAPGDDLLTGLIAASENEDRLSESEIVSMMFLLLIAGHDTTVNLLSNAVLSLLLNPGQLAEMRANPELANAAVEETLRFEAPVNLATVRHTREPVRLGDVEIPEGEIVYVALGSANRDGTRFDVPERFDLSRSGTGHLAFGHGIHFCLGAQLARMEGQIALRQLIERFPHWELAVGSHELRWRFSTLMRGLETLPVRFGPASDRPGSDR